MSSITQFLHTTTWDYFTSYLSYRFRRSSKEVKKAIMTDIDDLVQEFWRVPSDGFVEVFFYAMHRLLEILQECAGCFDKHDDEADESDVCFVLILFLFCDRH